MMGGGMMDGMGGMLAGMGLIWLLLLAVLVLAVAALVAPFSIAEYCDATGGCSLATLSLEDTAARA